MLRARGTKTSFASCKPEEPRAPFREGGSSQHFRRDCSNCASTQQARDSRRRRRRSPAAHLSRARNASAVVSSASLLLFIVSRFAPQIGPLGNPRPSRAPISRRPERAQPVHAHKLGRRLGGRLGARLAATPDGRRSRANKRLSGHCASECHTCLNLRNSQIPLSRKAPVGGRGAARSGGFARRQKYWRARPAFRPRGAGANASQASRKISPARPSACLPVCLLVAGLRRHFRAERECQSICQSSLSANSALKSCAASARRLGGANS